MVWIIYDRDDPVFFFFFDEHENIHSSLRKSVSQWSKRCAYDKTKRVIFEFVLEMTTVLFTVIITMIHNCNCANKYHEWRHMWKYHIHPHLHVLLVLDYEFHSVKHSQGSYRQVGWLMVVLIKYHPIRDHGPYRNSSVEFLKSRFVNSPVNPKQLPSLEPRNSYNWKNWLTNLAQTHFFGYTLGKIYKIEGDLTL